MSLDVPPTRFGGIRWMPLRSLANHPLTEKAAAEFEEAIGDRS